MPQLLLTILLIALGWALVIRPQQAELRAQRQRRQEHDQMLAGLEAGARVITAGGIHGSVTAVEADTVRVEVAPDIELTLAREAIHERIDASLTEATILETPVTHDPAPARPAEDRA